MHQFFQTDWNLDFPLKLSAGAVCENANVRVGCSGHFPVCSLVKAQDPVLMKKRSHTCRCQLEIWEHLVIRADTAENETTWFPQQNLHPMLYSDRHYPSPESSWYFVVECVWLENILLHCWWVNGKIRVICRPWKQLLCVCSNLM